jgi:hypothetical protein
MKTTPETFQKTDLNLAAYLTYIGYNMTNIEKNGSRYEFVFEIKSDQLEADLNAYYNGFTGNLHKFAQIQKTLKSRMYNI